MATGDQDGENYAESGGPRAHGAYEEEPGPIGRRRALQDVTGVGGLEPQACKGNPFGVGLTNAGRENLEALERRVVWNGSADGRDRLSGEPSGHIKAFRLVVDAGSISLQGSLASSCRPAYATNSLACR
jgi:hypothetical protein